MQSSVDGGPAGAYDSPTSAAAAADAGKPFGRDGSADGQQQHEYGGSDAGLRSYQSNGYTAGEPGGPQEVGYGQVPAKGWYLHACVVAAALGVRWWLLNQTDPLQRKVMLVIIWPVSAVATPGSGAGRAQGLACLGGSAHRDTQPVLAGPVVCRVLTPHCRLAADTHTPAGTVDVRWAGVQVLPQQLHAAGQPGVHVLGAAGLRRKRNGVCVRQGPAVAARLVASWRAGCQSEREQNRLAMCVELSARCLMQRTRFP
jgi:hypothetical protein